jgi:hypothetical protein
LASQVLVETADLERISKSNQRHVDRVRQSLVQLIKGHELPPVERALAGNNLATLGDPRPGVGTIMVNGIELPDIELCYVPPGPFWMGSPEDDPYAESNEKPLHQVDLEYGYWIGRYLVTISQFQTILKHNKYEIHSAYKINTRKLILYILKIPLMGVKTYTRELKLALFVVEIII